MSTAVLEAPPDTDYRLWLDRGLDLVTRTSQNLWDIGDWWAEGEHKHGDKLKAVAQTFNGMFTYDRLCHLGWTARSVKPVFRNQKLSFTHHVHVTTLDPTEQVRMLALAVEHKWTAKQLGHEVRKLKAPPTVSPTDVPFESDVSEEQRDYDAHVPEDVTSFKGVREGDVEEYEAPVRADPDRSFQTYYRQLHSTLSVVARFDWPQDMRSKMAEMLHYFGTEMENPI